MKRRTRYWDLMPRVRVSTHVNHDIVVTFAEEQPHAVPPHAITKKTARPAVQLSRRKLTLVVNQ